MEFEISEARSPRRVGFAGKLFQDLTHAADSLLVSEEGGGRKPLRVGIPRRRSSAIVLFGGLQWGEGRPGAFKLLTSIQSLLPSGTLAAEDAPQEIPERSHSHGRRG